MLNRVEPSCGSIGRASTSFLSPAGIDANYREEADARGLGLGHTDRRPDPGYCLGGLPGAEHPLGAHRVLLDFGPGADRGGTVGRGTGWSCHRAHRRRCPDRPVASPSPTPRRPTRSDGGCTRRPGTTTDRPNRWQLRTRGFLFALREPSRSCPTHIRWLRSHDYPR